MFLGNLANFNSFFEMPRGYFTTARVETGFRVILASFAIIPILTTLAILLVLIFGTAHFFAKVSLTNFLFNREWDAVFIGQNYGIGVLLSASLLVTAIAMVVAIPIGLMIAIYLSEYAPPALRPVAKSLIQSLAGIPTVVLGYFGFLVVTPFLEQIFPNIAPFNGLSAGLIIGAMVVPLISSISEEAIAAIPRELREGAYVLGFTRFEVILKIILPTAMPAIVASITLATSRAFGETMIAAIAAGQVPNLTFDPLVPVSTISAYILQVSSLGLSFNSLEPEDLLKYQTIFPLALVLLTITLGLNTIGHWLSRRYFLNIGNLVSFSQTEFSSSGKPSLLVYKPSRFMPKYAQRGLFNQVFQMFGMIAIAVIVFVIGAITWSQFREGWGRLDWQFFSSFSSNNPNEAGIFAALVGTIWLLTTSLILVLPIGIGGAIFIEEYLPDSQMKDWLEIQIANLAALPTIIYGILGLELFVRICQPITGGKTILSGSLTLAAILMPVLILSVKSALQNVPQDLRQAAYAGGMSQWQVICYVVLPEAMPDILQSITFVSAIALGETAAIMAIIGSLGVISFVPSFSFQGFQSEFISLPMQIYLWETRPEPEFQVNGAAATVVLIGILLLINLITSAIASFMRRHR
jgi:phosphate transport system permease protein